MVNNSLFVFTVMVVAITTTRTTNAEPGKIRRLGGPLIEIKQQQQQDDNGDRNLGKNKKDNGFDEESILMDGVPPLRYGVAGQLTQCDIRWWGHAETFDYAHQVSIDKVFKSCLNRHYHDAAGEIHFDICQGTYQHEFVADESVLTEDGGSGERRLSGGIVSKQNVWWGCSDCANDSPTSDAYRRGRELSLHDIGDTTVNGAEDLFHGTWGADTSFERSAECLGEWAMGKPGFEDVTGISLECDDFDPVYVSLLDDN
mmetsp:Transcript_2292/g.3318  ORF Transcript_2292/g.3318 Transcript_2292/m.3318 type:complete len:257 (-) Transcript_2292:166-936(-)